MKFTKGKHAFIITTHTDKAGTAQHERDIKKNHILEKCGLKLVRLGTNESGEREKIVGALNTL